MQDVSMVPFWKFGAVGSKNSNYDKVKKVSSIL
jgi:hypothetical protein